ncbi:MAG: hypothetical protein HEP71_29655 [Roseivirga sp.]|nr:hypothetical protein [Roseivirga sp.]
MMKQRVVVLGGGTFQLGLITELKTLGFEVHVVTNRCQDKGFTTADQGHDFAFTDVDRLIALMQELGAVQVLTAGSELALTVLAEVQAALGLPGNSSAFVMQFQHKASYKTSLRQSCPECVPETFIYSGKDSKLLNSFISSFRQGVIVKPAVGRGSKSVAHCHTTAEIINHLRKHRLQEVIIEAYLEGPEYGGDFLVRDGQLLVESCTLKGVNAWLVPTVHLMLEELQDNVRHRAFFEKIIRHLRLPDGVYNADIIDCDGQLKLIDLSPRIGGNCIPDLVKMSRGISEWQFMTDLLLNKNMTPFNTHKFVPHGVYMIGATGDGEIQSLVTDQHPFGESVIDLFWRVSVTETVAAFTEGARHLGYVMYKAKTDAELLTLRERIEGFEWFTWFES